MNASGGRALAVALGLCFASALFGQMFAQTPGERIILDAVRVIAGESKPIQWRLLETQIDSIVSVRSSPELAFPIRVDLGAGRGLPLRLTVPPATPPGEYEIEVIGHADDGRALSASLRVAVSSVTVSPSPTGRPPVVLLNGFQLVCTDTGSALTDSQGTFGQMWSYLQAESVSVLFFNNCAYGDITIEQLATQLNLYVLGLTYTDGTPVSQVDLVAHSMGGLIVRAYLAGLQPGDSTFLFYHLLIRACERLSSSRHRTSARFRLACLGRRSQRWCWGPDAVGFGDLESKARRPTRRRCFGNHRKCWK